jgi:hypothetical protein
MEIEVIRAFCIGGERQEVGSQIEVDDRFARELMHNGKARPAKKTTPPKAAPVTPAKEKTK